MNYLIEPWKHQLQAIKNADGKPHYALFFEMGTGKTATSINMWRQEAQKMQKFFRTFVITPPITLENWKAEWKLHSKVPKDKVIILYGSQKKRLADFKKYKAGGGRIFITNYESLGMKDLYEEFLRWRAEAIIFDEAHKLKNRTTQRSKAADLLANPWDKGKKMAICTPIKYILTGTPILNSAEDLWHQYKVLDGGATFGHNFHIWKRKYFIDRNSGMPRHLYFPNWEIRTLGRDKFDALGEITEKIQATSMRVKKHDCLDLPPFIRQMEQVEMTPKQRKIYKSLKDDFVAYLEDSKVVMADMAMTKGMRLMQITSGFCKTTEGEEIKIENTPKDARLKELLSELTPNHKVLVWAVWKHNYNTIRTICEQLRIKFVEVHGEVSAAQKFKNVDSFNNDASVRVFLGHPGSGGIGVNLVPSDYSIFYSRNFSLEQSLQAEARNHRGGSNIHERVTRIDLVCRDTIDKIVTETLAQKKKIGDKVLRDIGNEL